MRKVKVHFNKMIIGSIFFIIVLSVTIFSFAQDKVVVIPLFGSEATAPEISFCVKRQAIYDWPQNATQQQIDFSSGSQVWYNNGAAFDTSTSRFVAPAPGVYMFNGVIQLTDLSTGFLIYAYITAGGRKYYGSRKHSTGSDDAIQVSVTVHLDTGQWASLGGYVNASGEAKVYGDYTFTSANTYLMGAKVF